MTQARWDVSEFDVDNRASTERPIPTLVSLHFVRAALRRRWLVCVLAGVLGLLAAAAFLVASTGSHTAKATLVLAHDPQVDPSRAMATDVSLLGTRTVATKTIASLGLTMSPDEFLKSVTVEPVSSELLSLTLSAPSDAEAVDRLTALTSTYLDFRAEQLSMQSDVLVGGMQERIKTLQGEVAGLSRTIDQLATRGNPSARLSDAIAQRANLQGQIETLQQSVEDATLRHTSVVSSSRVIDPAATDAAGLKRRIALALASGLIGGLALGCGIVLFFAIISDRLRRRSDVAGALEVPVPVSVGKIAPIPKRWLWLPHVRAVDGRRTDERQRLARAIELELPVPGQRGRLAVACIDNADEVRFAFAAAAADLAAGGRSIALIDLTEHGTLNGEVARLNAGSTNSTPTPTVFRPRGIPALAGDAADLRAVGHEDGSPPQLERNDVTLVLADLDPSVGAHHLKTWTDRVIVPVTAGHSSAERVTTAAELVRTAGLEMRVAVLLRTERTDNSSGVSGFSQPAAVPLDDGHEQPLLEFEEQVDTGLAAEIMTVTAAAAATPESDEDRTVEELDAESRPTIDEEQTPADKQTAGDKEATAEDQATPDQQQAEAVLHADGEAADAEQLVEAKVDAEDERQPETEVADEDERHPEAEGADEDEQQPIAEVADDEHQPMAEVSDAEAEQQGDTEVRLEVEPEPEAEVAEEQQIAELLAQGTLQADAEVAEPKEQVEAEITAEVEPQAEAEVTDAELAETEVADGKQQPEAHAAEEQPEAEELLAQGVLQADAEVAQTEELVDSDVVSAEVEPQPEADVGEEAEVEEQQSEVAEAQEQVEAVITAEGEPQAEAEVADAEQQPRDDVTDAEQQADAEEQQADDQQSLGDHQKAEEEQTTSDEEAVSEQPENAEQKPDAEPAREADASAEADQVPDGSEEGEGSQSWNLYLVKYPPVHVGSAPGPGGNGLDSDHDSAANGVQGEAENGKEPRLAPDVTEEVDGRATEKEPASDGQVSNGQSATRTRRRPRRRRRKVQNPSSSRV